MCEFYHLFYCFDLLVPIAMMNFAQNTLKDILQQNLINEENSDNLIIKQPLLHRSLCFKYTGYFQRVQGLHNSHHAGCERRTGKLLIAE